MAEDISRLFEWRKTVLSDQGPPDAMTRYVLLVLSVHMDADGDSCFPSIELLAEESALNERTNRPNASRTSSRRGLDRPLDEGNVERLASVSLPRAISSVGRWWCGRRIRTKSANFPIWCGS
jgi:hypothetical protein